MKISGRSNLKFRKMGLWVLETGTQKKQNIARGLGTIEGKLGGGKARGK